MSNLSPAAQVVVHEYSKIAYDNNVELSFTPLPWEKKAIAAALRAVASQFDRLKRSDAHVLWNEGFQQAQNVCRADLLNIADELEDADA